MLTFLRILTMALTTTKKLLLATQQSARHKAFQRTLIPSSVSVEEISLLLRDGMTLAGQRWTYHGGDDGTNTMTAKNKILALHGWMDNSASFHYLAPHLVHKLGGKAELVALDLPGHGLSSHKSLDGPSTLLSEGVYYVVEALHQLGWNIGDDSPSTSPVPHRTDSCGGGGVTIIGHSMGGGIGLVCAAAYPEHVDKLVMLDIYGPLPGESDKSVTLIRSHIEARRKGARPNRVYPTLEQAIQTRQLTATKAPGKQWLSIEAATEMVHRATTRVQDAQGKEGWSFRHDTRLLWPSMQNLMPEQIDSIMKSVECPTCILIAEHGWPFKKERVDKALEILQPCVHKILPGSHHLHADPNTAEAALNEVYRFVAEKKMKYVL
jgi:pimeloyl-ACP methyl ester carboxylesterase